MNHTKQNTDEKASTRQPVESTQGFIDIDFPQGQILPWLGRNGQFKAKGIALTHSSINTIMIEPRTMRGGIGRCLIEFPVSSIPEVIKFLQSHI